MDEISCSKHINIECDEYIKYHIQKSEEMSKAALQASEKLADANLKALQLEFSKSERVYPTKEQIDERLKGLVSKDEIKERLDGISLQMKLQWGILVALLILFLADYLRR